ncbi:hypothetical protein V6Z11_1Z057500 [Gossypium hirsutum]
MLTPTEFPPPLLFFFFFFFFFFFTSACVSSILGKWHSVLL